MWQFLSRNKQVAAMVALLSAAALVALVLATRGSSHYAMPSGPQETEDVSDKPWIFACHTLPSDSRFMPSIGNGHVATNIFSDTVFMNGLYNGRAGESHRARIPAWSNVRLNSTLGHLHYAPVYSLDTRRGVFEVIVDRERSVVRQRLYAHRHYTRTVVNQILVTAKSHVDPNFTHQVVWIDLKRLAGDDSEDIAFAEPSEEVIEGHKMWSSCGKTKVSEDLNYQPLPVEVCAFWSAVPGHLVVPRHGSKLHTFIMTVDKNKETARNETIKGDLMRQDHEGYLYFYERVKLMIRCMDPAATNVTNMNQSERDDDLFAKHTQEWEKLRYQAEFTIEGNLKLAKIVNGIWYYFLSALPSQSSYQPLGLFYGLSPTGLAGGKNFDDYEGHNLWDTEIWMFPSILLMYPTLAEQLLHYRLQQAPAAEDLARESGYDGYRFPWESAYTGREVTQPCCPYIAELEQHISGSIAFAIRQYLAVTRDDKWLKKGGCALVTNIADFWASRAKLNYSTGFYDISNVMGPDEDHINITNSVFTNVVAGYSLYLAQYVACLCSGYYATADSERWADVAWGLALPYDPALDYHPQFEGYRRGDVIKQADAALLGYPLLYPMNESTRANDLSYYERVTRGSGPAMTWSMHTIGQLRLHDKLRAASLFNRSYAGYVREPFKVWSEQQRPRVGAVNFYTGMGGLLQALVFGYGGLAVHLDRLEIRTPQLPPEATRFQIRGIKYLGANLTLDIELARSTLHVEGVSRSWPLLLISDGYHVALHAGVTVTLRGDAPFKIVTTRRDRCPLPADTIGNVGERPLAT